MPHYSKHFVQVIEKMTSDDLTEQAAVLTERLEQQLNKKASSMLEPETIKIAERAFDDPSHLKAFQTAITATPSECTEEEARKIIPLWQAEQIQLFYSFSPPEAEEKGARVKEEECDRTLSAFALITSIRAIARSPIQKAFSSEAHAQIIEEETSKHEFQDALTYHIFRTHAGLSDSEARVELLPTQLVRGLSSLLSSLEKLRDGF